MIPETTHRMTTPREAARMSVGYPARKIPRHVIEKAIARANRYLRDTYRKIDNGKI